MFLAVVRHTMKPLVYKVQRFISVVLKAEESKVKVPHLPRALLLCHVMAGGERTIEDTRNRELNSCSKQKTLSLKQHQ